MDESKKNEFVDLVFNNINIIHKICAIYSDKDDEDLKQDIIYELWKSYSSFEGRSKFQTWMYRVALNTVLLGLRKKQLITTELDENSLNTSDPFTENQSEQLVLLYNHISKLSDIDKAITLRSGFFSIASFVASIPFITGIEMSINTRSGSVSSKFS